MRFGEHPYTQSSNHSSTEYRTNYGVKFNFIGIKKKLRVFLIFFLKGRQINFFKLLYIKKKVGQGGLGTTLTLRWLGPPDFKGAPPW